MVKERSKDKQKSPNSTARTRKVKVDYRPKKHDPINPPSRSSEFTMADLFPGEQSEMQRIVKEAIQKYRARRTKYGTDVGGFLKKRRRSTLFSSPPGGKDSGAQKGPAASGRASRAAGTEEGLDLEYMCVKDKRKNLTGAAGKDGGEGLKTKQKAEASPSHSRGRRPAGSGAKKERRKGAAKTNGSKAKKGTEEEQEEEEGEEAKSDSSEGSSSSSTPGSSRSSGSRSETDKK